MASPKTLALFILDQEYRVNCPEGAESKLRAAAQYLNDKMLEIKSASMNSGKVLSLDRIAVIAALNISHQLQEVESGQKYGEQELRHIHQILDEALAQDQQLELD